MKRRAFLGLLAALPVVAPVVRWTKRLETTLVLPSAPATPALPIVGDWRAVQWTTGEFDWGNSFAMTLKIVNEKTGERRRNACRLFLPIGGTSGECAATIARGEEVARELLKTWMTEVAVGVTPEFGTGLSRGSRG